MLGAIIGDFAGSIYEFGQIKTIKPIKMQSIFPQNAFFSDDTILTCAVADAILREKPYEEKLKEYVQNFSDYHPSFKPYFKNTFSSNFIAWARGENNGTSSGNGAMMRVSPVGFWFETQEEVVDNVVKLTKCSHDSEDAIACAKIVALVIFFARKGFTKNEIRSKLGLKIKKHKIEKFNFLSRETLDICLYSFFKSSSFEDCIKIALSFGGDTDTNACISASMAEAFYGIDENLKKQAKAMLPKELLAIVNEFYDKLNKKTKEHFKN